MTTLRNLAIVLSLFAALAFSGSARTDGIMSGPCVGCEGITNVGAGKTCASTPTVSGLSVASGPTSGGTSVTITGTNFTGATAVGFGGTPAATFSVSNSTTIVATSPAASAGTVDVRVTQCATSPTSSADQFTFFAAPTVTAVSPNTGSSSGGTAVTVSGTNFIGATVVDFGPANPASFSVTNSTTIAVASTPSGTAGVVDVTVTTPGGTSATSAADQYTYTGASFHGIGDFASYTSFWGLRGYSSTYAAPGTNPAADLVDQAGANSITIKILSSGDLDVATVATWVTAHSVTTIKVTKLYDQAGGGVSLTQATLSKMPQLVLSAFGALPGLRFVGANSESLNGSFILTAQPISFSAIAERLTGTSFSGILSASGSNTGLLAGNSSGTVYLFAGTQVSSAWTEAQLHALNGLLSGVSSNLRVDATPNPVSVGTTGFGAPILGNTVAIAFDGYVNEAAFATADVSASFGTVQSNQKNYWGTP